MADIESEGQYNLMVDTKAEGPKKEEENGGNLVKKGLVSMNELNEKLMKSNGYFIFFVLFLYIMVGVAIYHHWMGWNLLESLYFIIITCVTVGYGDYVPHTTSQRTFTAFFIIVGIAMCGSMLGVLSTFVFEHQARMTKQRNYRSFVHMKEKKVNPEVSNALLSAAGAGGPPLDPETGSGREGRDSTSSATAGVTGATPRRRRSILQMATSYSFAPSEGKTFEEIREDSISGYMEDLLALRVQSIRDFLAIFLILIFGMVVMVIVESWSAADSFYWATVTLTTVGYGDIVPKTRAGIIFTIFYVLIGCVFLGKALTDFVKYPLLSTQLQHEVEVINQFAGELSHDKLESIFQNDFYKLIPDLKRSENEMTKCEFVLMVLQLMNKVEEKDIFLVAKLFENLDTDRKGYLSNEDMNEQVSAAVTRDRARSLAAHEEEAAAHGGSPGSQSSNGSRPGLRRSLSPAVALWKSIRLNAMSPAAVTQRRPQWSDSPSSAPGGIAATTNNSPFSGSNANTVPASPASAPPQRRPHKAKSTTSIGFTGFSGGGGAGSSSGSAAAARGSSANVGVSLTSRLFPQDEEDHYSQL